MRESRLEVEREEVVGGEEMVEGREKRDVED